MTVRGSDAEVPEALHRRCRGHQRYCAGGRDSCVSTASPPLRFRSYLATLGPTEVEYIARGRVLDSADAGRHQRCRSSCRVERSKSVAIAPIMAAMFLGGPAVGGLGRRDRDDRAPRARGRIPWYGTLANHAGLVLPAVVGGVVVTAVARCSRQDSIVRLRIGDGGGGRLPASNLVLASSLLGLRTGQSVRRCLDR